ncbi:MAG: UvrB/UvrC motif-containing protein [Treponemataceae bacterium]
MKCEICGNRNAVVFVQQINGDSRSEIRLCAECAKERGLKGDGDIAQSVAKLLATVSGTKKTEKEIEEKVCAICGMTLVDARKNGYAGCPSCWDQFAVELLRKTYKDAQKRRHAGRLPVRLEEYRATVQELIRTREKLAASLQAEDYETAARCRDRLQALENRGPLRA